MARNTHDLDEVNVTARDEDQRGVCVLVEVGEVVLDLSPGEARHFARRLTDAADMAAKFKRRTYYGIGDEKEVSFP